MPRQRDAIDAKYTVGEGLFLFHLDQPSVGIARSFLLAAFAIYIYIPVS